MSYYSRYWKLDLFFCQSFYVWARRGNLLRYFFFLLWADWAAAAVLKLRRESSFFFLMITSILCQSLWQEFLAGQGEWGRVWWVFQARISFKKPSRLPTQRQIPSGPDENLRSRIFLTVVKLPVTRNVCNIPSQDNIWIFSRQYVTFEKKTEGV